MATILQISDPDEKYAFFKAQCEFIRSLASAVDHSSEFSDTKYLLNAIANLLAEPGIDDSELEFKQRNIKDIISNISDQEGQSQSLIQNIPGIVLCFFEYSIFSFYPLVVSIFHEK